MPNSHFLGPARLIGAALLVAVWIVVGPMPAQAAAPPAGSRVLFTFQDPRIDEASGIARGIRSPGVVYVQNDSGDTARFFAVDIATGATRAVYTVPGATNVDWEDIAVATDSRGVPSVWLADIGDNEASRSEVRIYRVDEPTVTATDGASVSTSTAQVWRLSYPDGPRDAESLAVAPGGRAYIFDKSLFGTTTAYAVPSTPNSGAVQPLTAIGSFDTVDTGTPGGPNPIGQRTATSAALSRSGDVLAVRTYTDAYLWRVGADGIAGALKRSPTRIALPAQPQGEGIDVDGDRLLTSSEKVGSQVWSVPLPSLPALMSSSASSPAPSSAPAAVPSASGSTPSGTGSSSTGVVLGMSAAVVVGVLVVVGLLVRRRMGSDRPAG